MAITGRGKEDVNFDIDQALIGFIDAGRNLQYSASVDEVIQIEHPAVLPQECMYGARIGNENKADDFMAITDALVTCNAVHGTY